MHCMLLGRESNYVATRDTYVTSCLFALRQGIEKRQEEHKYKGWNGVNVEIGHTEFTTQKQL